MRQSARGGPCGSEREVASDSEAPCGEGCRESRRFVVNDIDCGSEPCEARADETVEFEPSPCSCSCECSQWFSDSSRARSADHPGFVEYGIPEERVITSSKNENAEASTENEREAREFRGEIVSTGTETIADQTHRTVRLRLDSGRIEVIDLGREDALSDVNLRKGDKITARARRADIDGRSRLLASELKIGDRRLGIDQPRELRLQGQPVGREKGERNNAGRKRSNPRKHSDMDRENADHAKHSDMDHSRHTDQSRERSDSADRNQTEENPNRDAGAIGGSGNDRARDRTEDSARENDRNQNDQDQNK